MSVLPALNTGTVEAATDRVSPVRGLRAVRAGRFLVPNAPKPRIRASSHSPGPRRSPRTRRQPLPSQQPCSSLYGGPAVPPVPTCSSILVPPVLRRRVGNSGQRNARCPHPTTMIAFHSRCAAVCELCCPAFTGSPFSARRSNACTSAPSRRDRVRCAPPCGRMQADRRGRTRQGTPLGPCRVSRHVAISSRR